MLLMRSNQAARLRLLLDVNRCIFASEVTQTLGSSNYGRNPPLAIAWIIESIAARKCRS